MVEAEGGVKVKVLAGRVGAVKGVVDTGLTDPTYLDVVLPPGAAFTQPLPVEHNAFVYVYDGGVLIEGRAVKRGEIAVLTKGARVVVTAAGEPTRLLLIAGKPLGEPIVRHGPFVMNTVAEIHQAVADFTSGRF